MPHAPYPPSQPSIYARVNGWKLPATKVPCVFTYLLYVIIYKANVKRITLRALKRWKNKTSRFTEHIMNKAL